jgi:hypothetical protein
MSVIRQVLFSDLGSSNYRTATFPIAFPRSCIFGKIQNQAGESGSKPKDGHE